MANEEEVGVKITATTEDLTAGAEKAKTGLDGIAESAMELKETLLTVAEAMGAMWAIDKLEEFTEHMATLGEEVEHTAAMTGLSVEKVQDFQYAIEATGGTTQNANLALVQLERHISEAAQGVGDAVDAFQRLGVSQKELQSGDINAIMKTMADTMHNTADGANKVEAMYRAVGRSGAQLIPIFDLGAQAIDEMNQKFAETGAQMSEGMSEQLTLMAQQLYLAESAATGVGIAFMSRLLPGINGVLVGLTSLREDFSAAATSGGFLTETLDYLSAGMAGLTQAIISVKGYTEIMYDSAGSIWNSLVDKVKGYGEVISDIAHGKMAQAIVDWAVAGKKANDEIDAGTMKVIKDYQTMHGEIDKVTEAFLGMNVGIGLGRGDQDKQFAPPKAPPQEQNLSAQRALFAQQYDTKKEYDQLMVQSGQMSNAQMFSDLSHELDLEEEKVNLSFDIQAAQYKSDSAKYKELTDQKEAADQRFINQHLALNLQAAKTEEKTWQEAYKQMSTYTDAFVLDELRGTKNMGAQFQEMTQKMLSEFISAIALMTIKWLAFQALKSSGFADTAKSVAGMSGGQSSLMGTLAANMLSLVGITTTQEGTELALSLNIAANTAALSANTAALGASSGGGSGGGGGGVGAGLGLIGDLIGFASGADYVPNNMVAQIHKGEMIIPAGPADAIRQGAALEGGYGSADTHVHFHTASLDPHTAAKMWTRNSAGIAKAVKSAARGNTGGFKSAFARM